MAPKREEFQIGPWPGGLNTVDTPDEIADNEVTEAVNVIFDRDGVAYFRPPIINIGTVGLTSTTTVLTGRNLFLIGAIRVGSATRFIIQDQDGGVSTTGKLKTWDYTPGLAGANPQPNNGIPTWDATRFGGTAPGAQIGGVVEYNSALWFYKDTSMGTGGYTCPIAMATALTAVPNMPQGLRATVYKDRMFIMDATSLRWSKATDPTIWAAPDGGFVNIEGATTGTPLIDFVLLNGTFYIFHKSGVYTMNYTTDPAIDGVLQKISSVNVVSACEYQGRIFVFDGKAVLELIGINLLSISPKINFAYSLGLPQGADFFDNARLWGVGGFLMLTYTLVGFGALPTAYVMNIETGAWSQWAPNNVPGTNARDNWPGGSFNSPKFRGMIKDKNDRFAIFTGAHDTNAHIVAIDFNYIFGRHNDAGATLTYANKAGATDVRYSTAAVGTWIPQDISIATKRFNFGDPGMLKRMFFVRSYASLFKVSTSHSHVAQWSAMYDFYETTPSGNYSRASNTLFDQPGLVAIATGNRFRTVQFLYQGSGVNSSVSSTGNQRSFGIIRGLTAYIGRNYQERQK